MIYREYSLIFSVYQGRLQSDRRPSLASSPTSQPRAVSQRSDARRFPVLGPRKH